MVADQQTTATFIGSDEKTNLTLLKMNRVVGKPVRIGLGRPMDGSLVMMLNPNNGSGRVQLWTGGERDFGVVVSMDGSVAGFARYGQFLNTAAAKPVIDQLLAIGKVQRAVLGVRLTELRADHQLRRRYATLAERPALSVEEVTADSPAEKAGIKAGDVILEFQNQPIGDLTTWSAMLAGGGEGKLLILRDGKPLPIKMDLRPTE
jgi:membrane-associated protease RseP (regulator of RpoE activity)